MFLRNDPQTQEEEIIYKCSFETGSFFLTILKTCDCLHFML